MATDITALYCCVDDFCKLFADWEAHRLLPSEPTRQHPGKLSRAEMLFIVVLIDGVTGRQPTVVAAVAVPQSNEVRNGVRVGLLQTSSRDDHGALCRYRVNAAKNLVFPTLSSTSY
jgi:hypothetical protein